MIAAAIIAAAIAASPSDHLYVYGQPNRTIECPALRLYVDTEGLGSLHATGCVTQSVDWNWWPDFPLLGIRIDVEAIDTKRPIRGDCSFVAHAHIPGPLPTSTVIDCR